MVLAVLTLSLTVYVIGIGALKAKEIPTRPEKPLPLSPR